MRAASLHFQRGPPPVGGDRNVKEDEEHETDDQKYGDRIGDVNEHRVLPIGKFANRQDQALHSERDNQEADEVTI